MVSCWMNLLYSSSPICRMKTANISKKFWKLRLRKCWNNPILHRNIHFSKEKRKSYRRILLRKQKICVRLMSVSAVTFRKIFRVCLRNCGKQSACCLSWMKTERITWLRFMIWSRQKKGCYSLLSMQKMRSRKFWLL